MRLLDVKLVGGQMPTRAKEGDAAWDLYAPVGGYVYPQDMHLLSLDIRMAIPEGYCGILTHRSGLNTKGIVAYGTIDAGYRGILKVNLMNLSSKVFRWEAGDRIAQVRIVEVPNIIMREVASMSLETVRGEGGHGSTGV